MSNKNSPSLLQLVKDFTLSLADPNTLEYQTEDLTFPNTTVEIDTNPNFETIRFKRGELLGQGGMGSVHAAYDTVLHRDIAIKTLLQKTTPNSVIWKRFYREAQITAQLSHPSIVPVYSMEFLENNQPTLIMKRVKGITLTEFIKCCVAHREKTRFENSKHGLFARLDIIIRVCDAMTYAHAKGILHRDLKPDNIMVGDFEDVYVMDWGIACALDEDLRDLKSSIELTDLGIETLEGAMMGTLTYMPPEQARGDLVDIHYHSDQYTLGLILYEILTLERARPTENMTKADMIRKATTGEWDEKRFQETTKHLDPRLRAIIRKATEPKGHDRYPSISMMVDDLRSFTHNQAVLALPESRSRRLWRTLLNHPTVLLMLMSLIITAAAASTAFSIYSHFSAREEAERHRAQSIQLLAMLQKDATVLDKIFLEVKERGDLLAGLIEKEVANNDHQVDCLFYTDLEQSEHAVRHKQYGNNLISLKEPVCLLPNGSSPETATIGLPLADNITEDLIQSYVGTAPREEFFAKFLQQKTLHEIEWVYAGFADGTLINYPGINQFGEHYDPRKRPWYIQGKENTTTECGTPYPDASGIGYLLPCTRQLTDPMGDVVGVVGIDLLVDHLISQIEKNHFPQKIHVYLLNQRGNILFSDSEKGSKIERLKEEDNNASKKLSAFVDQDIILAIFNGKRQGIIEKDDSLFIFSTLDFVPWTLVYQLEPDIWECAECFQE